MPTKQSAAMADTDSGAELERPTPGVLLGKERQRRGLSEKEVADRLHITMHYVRALEADNYEKLPGAVFAKGYIKSYALLLELDPDELQGLYQEFGNKQLAQEQEASRQRTRSRRDRNRPWVVVSVLAFVGGFTALWAYNNFSSDDETPVPVAAAAETENETAAEIVNETAIGPVTESSIEAAVESSAVIESAIVESQADTPALQQPPVQVEEISASDVSSAGSDSANEQRANDEPEAETAPYLEPPVATVDPVIMPETGSVLVNELITENDEHLIEVAASGDDVLRISFSGESWVEVNDGASRQIYRDIREAGDVLEITGNAPFSVLLGDAPFTRLTFNGAEVDVSDEIRIDNSARLTVGLQ